MTRPHTLADHARRPKIWPIAFIAFASWLSIVLCLDPAGSYPDLPEGPGLTVDEIFNVEQGVYLVEQARSLGWLNLVPGTSQEAYRAGNGLYNPDHPPMGRWWLGLNHHLTWWLFPPFEPDGIFVTACARPGSALAFALTILMIGWYATIWSGRVAGIMTTISLVLMPRVYGHAHLASLETFANLTCTAAVVAIAAFWNGPNRPTKRSAIFAGILLGMAVLSKMQGVLIPIPVIFWTIWRWRKDAFLPLFLWGTTGVLFFFLMWPYQWFDPIRHGLEYLGRATNRATIQVWYMGQKYADKDVPWHYPFVMFALTVPLILHGMGLFGLFFRAGMLSRFVQMWHRERSATDLYTYPKDPYSYVVNPIDDYQKPTRIIPPPKPAQLIVEDPGCRSREALFLMCTIFPLIVFAIPSVSVYDGERLFLISFPLWAFFIGRGWAMLYRILKTVTQSRSLSSAACLVLMLIAGQPLVDMSPCHLSYYNSLTGLIPNADSRESSMEIDYWGVGITRGLLKQVAESVPDGEAIAIIPTLHQFQADDYRRQSPILRTHYMKTSEYHPDKKSLQYIIVYRRQADLPEAWNLLRPDETLGCTIRRNKMLAYFIQREI